MSKEINHNRRRFLKTAAVSIVTAEMAIAGIAHANFDKPKGDTAPLSLFEGTVMTD